MTIRKDLKERITMTHGVCGGRPCVTGTRIRVVDVLGLLVAGETRQNILKQYPGLMDDDITACLEFAQDLVAGIFPEQVR